MVSIHLQKYFILNFVEMGSNSAEVSFEQGYLLFSSWSFHICWRYPLVHSPVRGRICGRKLQNAPSYHEQVCKSCICSEEKMFFFSSFQVCGPSFQCSLPLEFTCMGFWALAPQGQKNITLFSSIGKLLKLWTCWRDWDFFVRILLQNLVKRSRSEVIAVWERVNFMPLEQLRILQASR